MEKTKNVEFPLLDRFDAQIQKIGSDEKRNILQLIIPSETAGKLLNCKGIWGSVEVELTSNQGAIPLEEEENNQTSMLEE